MDSDLWWWWLPLQAKGKATSWGGGRTMMLAVSCKHLWSTGTNVVHHICYEDDPPNQQKYTTPTTPHSRTCLPILLEFGKSKIKCPKPFHTQTAAATQLQNLFPKLSRRRTEFLKIRILKDRILYGRGKTLSEPCKARFPSLMERRL